MENFECHVTLAYPSEMARSYFGRLAEELGWSTSFIDGDPLLGQKRHFYFTRHDHSYYAILIHMETLVDRLTDTLGNVVLRRKIEKIVLDERTPIEP